VRKLPIFIVTLLLLVGLTLSPAETHTQVVQALGTPPVYNLYATDGYVNMADGTRQYIYGFVGGRAGDRLHC
jgi:hypothetical protein